MPLGQRSLVIDIGGGSTELAWVRVGCGPPSLIGYVRDALIILGIALGAWYLSEHPEKFDAFMYWIIGYRYRH